MRPIPVLMVPASIIGEPLYWVLTDGTTGSDAPVLSNSNLTAVGGSGSNRALVRANLGKNSGKYYFEVVIDAIGSPGTTQPFAGVAELGALDDVSRRFWIAYRNNSSPNEWSQFSPAGGSPTTGQVVTAGDVIIHAVSFTDGKWWNGRNGSWFFGGNPATNTAGNTIGTYATALYPAAGIDPASTGQQVTLRGTTADFSYSPPSGFTAWGE